MKIQPKITGGRALAVLLAASLMSASAVGEQLFDATKYRPLVADHRASRVGDNLTILISESAVVSATTSTRTNKEGSVGGFLDQPGTGNRNFRIGAEEDFTGGGTTSRSGRLVAQLTVTVLAVEPNGDLRVEGQQELEVNNEKQRIAIQGRVRPQDIDANNAVASSRVSFSKIEFVGQGLLSEKERQGILTRILSWLRIL